MEKKVFKYKKMFVCFVVCCLKIWNRNKIVRIKYTVSELGVIFTHSIKERKENEKKKRLVVPGSEIT